MTTGNAGYLFSMGMSSSNAMVVAPSFPSMDRTIFGFNTLEEFWVIFIEIGLEIEKGEPRLPKHGTKITLC